MMRTLKSLWKQLRGETWFSMKWIKDFLKKIRPLSQNTVLPLPEEAHRAFSLIKETDSSDHTLSAILNQQGRPVAFFSRTLNGPELKHSAIEKEAAAIVGAIRKWKHYLTGKHVKLITDQKSVAYMFDTKHHSKIKNDNLMRWRIELSMYNFDIIYRAGEENIPADALSRVKSISLTIDKLYELHRSLCHPATNVTPHERMFAYLRKSTSGISVPSWLTTPGPVLLKRHIRNSMYDPLVDEVDLLEANQQYAHVRFPDGREDTVSIKHLAPPDNGEASADRVGQSRSVGSAGNHRKEVNPKQTGAEIQSQDVEGIESDRPTDSTLKVDHQSQPLRRSERQRRAPDRLTFS
ncbi:Hypothetical predicted protein [Paramuricea clavata]|uniref:Uncharacterized protein n=1 Tax=Paramuricea clavata TaxID=317549 RepID=A0A7D9DSS4_PARCT|nr:Hypothetical predicted protein [Paramuricea clavata]